VSHSKRLEGSLTRPPVQRLAQHVLLRELLAPLGVASASAHTVVDGEAAMAPGEPARRQPFADGALATSSLSTSERNPCSSNFTGIAGGTTNSPSARKTPLAANTWMCWLNVTRSPKVCTNRINPGRPSIAAPVGLDQQSLHDMAQLPEQSAPAGKDRPPPWYGEDALPVSYGCKDVFLDPIPRGRAGPLPALERASASWSQLGQKYRALHDNASR